MWDPLPVSLLAQLVERCSDIAKVVGSNRNSHIWFLYIKSKNKKDVNKPVT